MGEFIDEIRSNPLLLAVGGFVLIILVYILYRKMKRTSAVTPANVDTGTPIPNVTYNNTYVSNPVVAPASTSVPTTTVTPTPTPVIAPTKVAGVDYPLIPFGQYSGPSYSNLQPNTHYTWAGVDYILKAGASGRLWGVTSTGKQVLLYGPASSYPASPTDTAHSGPDTKLPPVHVSMTGVAVPILNPPIHRPYVIQGEAWPHPLSSLWGISQVHHVSVSKLQALNPHIKNPDLIYPGQDVRVG